MIHIPHIFKPFVPASLYTDTLKNNFMGVEYSPQKHEIPEKYEDSMSIRAVVFAFALLLAAAIIIAGFREEKETFIMMIVAASAVLIVGAIIVVFGIGRKSIVIQSEYFISEKRKIYWDEVEAMAVGILYARGGKRSSIVFNVAFRTATRRHIKFVVYQEDTIYALATHVPKEKRLIGSAI